jgi:membrane-associated phospholipid phosphatase
MKTSTFFLFLIFSCWSTAMAITPPVDQSVADSVAINQSFYQFKPKQLIVPSSLILAGSIGLMTNNENWLDHRIQQKVVNEWNTPFKSYSVDNYLLAVPALSVYGLNLIGIKGKHQFMDRTLILGISTVASLGFVTILKPLTSNMRPDDTTYDSWPSGHTTLAFAGAEFMRMEFKERSPWYGIAAYGVATSVGVLRVYNNRHWITDVLAGAGFGVLSTKMAYWIFPSVKRLCFNNSSSKPLSKTNVSILPSYNGGVAGFYLAATF